MNDNPGLTAEQEKRLPDGAVVCDALGTVYRILYKSKSAQGTSIRWMREGAEVGWNIPRRPLVRLDNPPQVP